MPLDCGARENSNEVLQELATPRFYMCRKGIRDEEFDSKAAWHKISEAGGRGKGDEALCECGKCIGDAYGMTANFRRKGLKFKMNGLGDRVGCGNSGISR